MVLKQFPRGSEEHRAVGLGDKGSEEPELSYNRRHDVGHHMPWPAALR